MRHSQHTDNEILSLLCEADAGVSIAEICSTAHISLRTFYRWRKRFGGLTTPALRHMKDLEIENRRLRSMLDGSSERKHGAHGGIPLVQGSPLIQGSPLVKHSRPPRQEFGCGPGPSIDATKPSRGASLGRFASVRGTR